MGASSARRYNRNQAKHVVDGVQRILDRLNVKYTPDWLLSELHDLNHTAQCIQGEFQKIMRGYGEE